MKVNDTVFIRTDGDIRKYTVESVRSGNGKTFLDLISEDGLHNVTNIDKLGDTLFTDKSAAINSAIRFIKSHDCIIPSGMKFVHEECFIKYYKFGARKAFFGIMGNGMIYMKDFMTYEHMVDCGNVEAAKKYLEKYKKHHGGTENYKRICRDKPKLRVMYRCIDKSTERKAWEKPWIYSASGYCGVIQ